MEYPSRLIENAVNQIARLPGIGKKTALRLVLHLIRDKPEGTIALTDALNTLRSNIKFCAICHNISDHDTCSICVSHKRDRAILCVVEDAKDVMAIENTSQFIGLYHVLGGVISPMNGVGPADIKVESLVLRLHRTNCEIREVILALSPTMEGDTTAFYINRRLKDLSLRISVIARGVPVGGDLEYADEITLGRSITGRTLFS
ncbi:MAG: recombination mediator RecR [Chryseolinea sp.]